MSTLEVWAVHFSPWRGEVPVEETVEDKPPLTFNLFSFVVCDEVGLKIVAREATKQHVGDHNELRLRHRSPSHLPQSPQRVTQLRPQTLALVAPCRSIVGVRRAQPSHMFVPLIASQEGHKPSAVQAQRWIVRRFRRPVNPLNACHDRLRQFLDAEFAPRNQLPGCPDVPCRPQLVGAFESAAPVVCKRQSDHPPPRRCIHLLPRRRRTLPNLHAFHVCADGNQHRV